MSQISVIYETINRIQKNLCFLIFDWAFQKISAMYYLQSNNGPWTQVPWDLPVGCWSFMPWHLGSLRKGGLAVAFVVPGTGLLTAGGIGTALLLRKAWLSLDPRFLDMAILLVPEVWIISGWSKKLVKDPRFVENDHGDVYRWWKDSSEEKNTDGFFRLWNWG